MYFEILYIWSISSIDHNSIFFYLKSEGRLRTIVGDSVTVIVESEGIRAIINPIRIIARILVELENDTEYEREKLQERLAKLSGGVAVIRVGAFTELELKEGKQMVKAVLRGAWKISAIRGLWFKCLK